MSSITSEGLGEDLLSAQPGAGYKEDSAPLTPLACGTGTARPGQGSTSGKNMIASEVGPVLQDVQAAFTQC